MEKKSAIPFSIHISRNAELNKGLMLIAFGYVFCYLFMIDYSVEEMNVFYRWSTTSYSQFLHPALFSIWVILCSSVFFLNVGYLRGRYGGTQKGLSALQYFGFFLLVLMMFFPTHRAPRTTLNHYLYYYVHLFSAAFYAVSNMTCILGLFAYKKKTDKRFTYWLWGGIIFSVLVGLLFVVKICGFVETVPTLLMMAVLYVLNYTKLMEPKATGQPQPVSQA